MVAVNYQFVKRNRNYLFPEVPSAFRLASAAFKNGNCLWALSRSSRLPTSPLPPSAATLTANASFPTALDTVKQAKRRGELTLGALTLLWRMMRPPNCDPKRFEGI
jgi:hypothetical protein